MTLSRCLPIALLFLLAPHIHSANPSTDYNRSIDMLEDDRSSHLTASKIVNRGDGASAAATGFRGVLTYHNNNSRTGLNPHETILTPQNVNSSQFGKLFDYDLDGDVHAQPLHVANLSIAGITHHVVFVATEHDSVYAFDADGNQSTPLWQVSCIVLRSEEHTSELQSHSDLVCRLLLEKKKNTQI